MYLNKAFVTRFQQSTKLLVVNPIAIVPALSFLDKARTKDYFYPLMLLKRSKRKSILVVRLKSLSYAILK